MFKTENLAELVDKNITFHMTMNIKEPLQFTSPASGRYNTDHDRPAYESEGDAWPPLTRTVMRSYAQKEQSAESYDDFEADILGEESADAVSPQSSSPKIKKYPIIHGNSLAGALRRKAGYFLMDEAGKKGLIVKREHASILLNGSHCGKPEQVTLDQKEFEAVQSHVYAGLFGGGQSLFERTIQTNSFVPICQDLIDEGIIPIHLHGLATSSSLRDLLTYEHKIKSDGLLETIGRSSLLPQVLVDDKNAEKWLQEATSGTGTERGNVAYTYNEFIAPGVSMYSQVSSSPSWTYEQLGLAMQTLKMFCLTGQNGPTSSNAQYGSMKANGMGAVDIVIDLEVDGQLIQSAVSSDGINEEFSDLMNKFHAELPSMIDGLDLDAVYPIKAPAKAKEKKVK